MNDAANIETDLTIIYRDAHQMIRLDYTDGFETCEVTTIGLHEDETDVLIDLALAAQGADFGTFTAELS